LGIKAKTLMWSGGNDYCPPFEYVDSELFNDLLDNIGVDATNSETNELIDQAMDSLFEEACVTSNKDMWAHREYM
jgi:hypothetical protein